MPFVINKTRSTSRDDRRMAGMEQAVQTEQTEQEAPELTPEDRKALQQAHRQLQFAHSAYMHADADLHDAAATELSAATLHFDAVYMRVYGVSASDLRRRRSELLARGYRNHFPVA